MKTNSMIIALPTVCKAMNKEGQCKHTLGGTLGNSRALGKIAPSSLVSVP